MIRFFVISIYLLFITGLTSAGSVKGVVQFNGRVSPQKAHDPGKFKNICGAKIEKESLIIENKGLINVVLTLSGKNLKKAQSQIHNDYVLNQEGCRYIPHVLAIPKESTIKILASDPTNHNIHTYSFDNDPINLMMTPGQHYEQEFEEPEVIKIECDLHKWMSAWVIVTDNPFYAVSKSEGKFEIKSVPPGKYTLTAWHETLGTMTQNIKVGEGPSNINLDFSNNTPQVSEK